MPSCGDWLSGRYSKQTQALETSHSGVPINVGMHQSDSLVPEGSSDPIPPGPEGQIEIPFVPAHERQTLLNPQNHQLKDDTIVVVGHSGASRRKRKRDKAKGVTSSSQSKSVTRLGDAETSPSTGDHDWEVEEFDYSSIPNLLDNESKHGGARGVHEDDERKKKKQRHGKGMLMASSYTSCVNSTLSPPRHETTSTTQVFVPSWYFGR